MIKTFHETKRYTNDLDYFYIKNEYYRNNSVEIYVNGSVGQTIELSTDGVNWYSLSSHLGTQYFEKKLYFRSTDGLSKGTYDNVSFANIRGDVSLGGNLATLVDYTDVENVTTLPDYTFYRAFSYYSGGGDKIKDISKLTTGNITIIGDYGMYEMFNNSKIINGSADFNNITTIGDYAMYGFFSNSNQMITIPKMNSIVTVGDNGLRNCFNGCNNIKLIPDFSSVTTVGDSGFSYSFYACSSLSEIVAPNVQTWDQNKFGGWLNGAGDWVSGTKTVYCPTGVTIPTDNYNGIPSGWVRVDY